MSEMLVDADVLVLGGGPAGCWAALSAAEAGARVVLADKGYCGTSGAAASAGHGVWYVPPDPAMREEAMASREALGGHLADRTWSSRVIDTAYRQVNRLGEWGYPFPADEPARKVGKDGHVNYGRGLQGPAYMRLMRRRVTSARVRILDHSPALELLTDGAGQVSGARGVRRQKGGSWEVRAKAVVLATGGCTFLSGGLGCNVLTGEGSLMAAEVGAHFSGMEFSSAYAIAPAFSAVTKTAYYQYATFTHEDGSIVEGAGWHSRSPIARALDEGPVYAVLDQAPAEIHDRLRRGQPNFFAPFDRRGIDPFTQRFPVTLRSEATMRGTGGLHVADDECRTDVTGLFAAGDVATRELICGGFTGGASHNGAWAVSSGTIAGAGAARHALTRTGALGPVSGPSGRRSVFGSAAPGAGSLQWREVATAVQDEVLPYRKNYFRAGAQLRESLATLDRTWRAVGEDLRWTPEDVVHAREAAGMTAVARWMYTSALSREESRGMHKRLDAAGQDVRYRHRLLVGGLDELWTAPDPVAPVTGVDTTAAA
ncbi:FAD-binding protein [Pseudonocardia ailaonensis]|uniref:L-aspartate oxidase n=1 Tax=Pseudonocardia ailaonensis TaxID=367279 RepID=A0ABN2NPS5_9PSEU